MILYDENGNGYEVKQATPIEEIDRKRHYEDKFREKLSLYNKYYSCVVGDKPNTYYGYRVTNIEKDKVKIIRYTNIDEYNTIESHIIFKMEDLDGTDENFIRVMNRRAMSTLGSMKNEKIKLIEKYTREVSMLDERMALNVENRRDL